VWSPPPTGGGFFLSHIKDIDTKKNQLTVADLGATPHPPPGGAPLGDQTPKKTTVN